MSKPKGKRNAYNFFMKACKEEFKANHSNSLINYSEFSKVMSARWRSLSDNQKKYYKGLADQDKIRHEKEFEKYIKATTGQKPSKRANKDPNAPKRPTSSFLLFSQTERPIVRDQHPGLSMTEVSKVLGRRWKTIDSTLKAVYEDLARVDRERYATEIEEYKRTEEVNKSSGVQEEEEDADDEEGSNEMTEDDQQDSD